MMEAGCEAGADAEEDRSSERTAEDRQAVWESKWAEADFVPRWRIDSMPLEIRQAVEQAWFPVGASVLDIGCGSGEIAAWLAGRGYDVLGVDFSPSAIARAERDHGDIPRLSFRAVDICRAAMGRFGALVDRGCMQGVPTEAKPDYARTVAAAASTGTRFLLLHRIGPGDTRERVIGEVEALIGDTFDIARIADTVLARDRADPSLTIEGVAFWSIRR